MAVSYQMPKLPRAGEEVKANWGKQLVDTMRRIAIVPKVGQRISKTTYGTSINLESESGDEDWTEEEEYPFKVRWYRFDKTGGSTDGEWQICLPFGCATVTQEQVIYNYLPENEEGNDGEGGKLYKWYKLDDPEDEDAKISNVSRYIAKQWTVRVLFKPWPRMKAITSDKDDEFGLSQWSVAVATISELTFNDDARTVMHTVTAKTVGDDEGNLAYSWPVAEFGIRYTVDGKKVKAEVVNQQKIIGRVQVQNEKATDVKDWKTVWVKYNHPSTQFTLTLEKDLSGKEALSDDDKTVYKIYDLDDGVVVQDYRSSVPAMNFYTNGPEVPED